MYISNLLLKLQYFFLFFYSYKLYVVFWSLTLYDLHVPKGRYEEEINKAKDVISALENNQEMVCVCVCVYLYVCVSTCTYVYLCVCMFVHLYVCICVCLCICVSESVCVCVCVSEEV